MLHLDADSHPLGFPGTDAEMQYLATRIQQGWDLVAVLAAGITYRYYWKKFSYDADPGPWVNRTAMGS